MVNDTNTFPNVLSALGVIIIKRCFLYFQLKGGQEWETKFNADIQG